MAGTSYGYNGTPPPLSPFTSPYCLLIAYANVGWSVGSSNLIFTKYVKCKMKRRTMPRSLSIHNNVHFFAPLAEATATAAAAVCVFCSESENDLDTLCVCVCSSIRRASAKCYIHRAHIRSMCATLKTVDLLCERSLALFFLCRRLL